jgi:hypothetical protein
MISRRESRKGGRGGFSSSFHISTIQHALALLLQAFEAAAQTRSSIWEFALELDRLRAVGATDTDLRWLAQRKLVDHGIETTRLADEKRSFKKTRNLTLGPKTYFVLTAQGASFARARGLRWDAVSPHGGQATMPAGQPHQEILLWSGDIGELWFLGLPVKRIRRPAPNQRLLFQAFQEMNWARCIDDPLPKIPGVNRKRRLAHTIEALNAGQVNHLIHFYGDGTGTKCCWEPLTKRGQDL